MKRPGPVTASVVVLSVLVLLSLVMVVSFAAAGRGKDTTTPRASSLTVTLATFAIPMVAAVVDIVFLILRRRWVYYYNIAIVSSLILFFVVAIIVSVFVIGRTMKDPTYRIMLSIFYTVPIGLLSWLLAELIKRNDVRDYLSRSRNPQNDSGDQET